MPLSNKQLGNTFIQGQNIIIYPSGNSYVISKPDTESYGATGIGVAGIDFFPIGATYVLPIDFLQDLTGPNSTMIYKSFSAGTGIGIIDSNNTLIFTASTPTVNGLTSFTSSGTGNRLLLSTAITSNTLFYKSFSAGTGIGIIDSNNTLIFTKTSIDGTIISGTNVGTNANSIGFFTGLSTTTNPNDTLVFRNLLEGPNITIAPSSTNNGDILISRGSPILVNQLLNIGDGSRVLSSITTTNLASTRTISGANGFSSTLGAALIPLPTSSTSSDATAFITAASITDLRQITAIQNLVSDLKTNNIWDKMLAIYPLVGGTANSHKYNLKDPRDLNAAYRLDFGSLNVIHDLNGIRSDAPNSSFQPTINTFIQLNLISALTDNIHASFYSRTNVNNTPSPNAGAVIGNTTSAAFRFYPNYNGQFVANISDNGFSFPTVSDSLGFYIVSRTGSTNTFYKNGFLSAFTSNTVHFSSITGSIILMRFNFYPENSRQIAFYSFGSGLTNSEALAYTTAVENYQATLGRQVVTLQNQTVRIAPTNTTLSRLYISNATSQLTTDANFGADVTSGSLSIGAAVSTTSRLLLAAGTGAISQLRLTAFSAEPTNPSDGSIWYSTSGNTLKFEKGTNPTDFIFKDNNLAFSGASNILIADTGGTISPFYINPFGLFTSISSLTLTDTISETSIISSILTGSTTLLASTNQYTPELIAGRKFRFNAKGTLIITDFSNLTLRLKLGNTIIGLVNNIGLSDTINGYFEIDYTFTIRSTGPTGSVFGSGKILSDTALKVLDTNSYPIGIYTNNTTIDTTSNQIFDCTIEFDLVAGQILTINESSLEFLT